MIHVILIITFVSSVVFGNDQKDYDFVIQTCKMDLNSLATAVESTKKDSIDYFNFLFPDVDTPAPNNVATRKGIGKNTYRILNSARYHEALKECFPNDEYKRNLYTVNLLMLDAYGKAATLSIMGLGSASIYKGLAFLGRKIAVAPTVIIFKKLGASEAFVSRLPRRMGTTGAYAFNAIVLGSLVKHVYDYKKEKEIMGISDESIETREHLVKNLELYQYTLKLRSQAQTPEERATIDALLLEQKDTVLFYLDSTLEEKDLNIQERKNLIVIKENLANKGS